MIGLISALLVASLAISFFWRRSWVRRLLDLGIVVSAALLLANPTWFASDDTLVLATPPGGRGDLSWGPEAGGIVSPAQIPLRTSAGKVRVIGAGMPLASWLEEPDLVILPETPSHEGPSWSWPLRVTVGEPIVIEGPADEPVQIALAGGLPFDEAMPENGRVRFSFVPRVTGPIEYHLMGKGLDETVGILVQPPPPLRFAMEFSRPAFESNGLKRYLAAIGGDGTATWKIAPDLSRTETVNAGASPRELDQLDLWIGDSEAFNERRNALLDASADGLGILLLVDTLPGTELPLAIVDRDRADGDSELWIDDPNALWTSDSTMGRFGYVKQQAGRIGVSVLSDTYRIITAQGMDAYAAIWSGQLEALLRPPPEGMSHTMDDALPMVRSAMLTCAPRQSGVPEIIPAPALMLDAGQRLDSLCVRWWPNVAGWHSLTIDGHEESIRIYDHDQWRKRVFQVRTQQTLAASVINPTAIQFSGERRGRPSIWLTLLGFFWISSWLTGLRKAADSV